MPDHIMTFTDSEGALTVMILRRIKPGREPDFET